MSEDRVKKIHVGPGTATWDPGGDDEEELGYSEDGGNLRFARTVEDIEVDQIVGPAGFFVTDEELEFEMILKEMDLEKLKVAMGQGTITEEAETTTDAGYTELEFGSTFELPEAAFEYRAPKRTNRNLAIVVHFYKAVIVSDFDMAFQKDGSTGYRVQVRARPDMSKDEGKRLGYIREETAEATG